jgi:signal transduction histidine kinase
VQKRADLIVAVVFAGFASVYLVAGSPLALAVFGIQTVLIRRRVWWLAALQVVTAYAAVLLFGTSVGILGFAAGALLLTGPRLLALPVVAGAVLLGPLDPAISAVLIAMVTYGLTTMIDRFEDVRAARLSVAMRVVAEERLAIAAELNDKLGRALRTIGESARAGVPDVDTTRASLAEARNAAASFRAVSLTPEITTAKAMLTAQGVHAEVRIGHDEPLGPAGALLAAVLRASVVEIVRRRTAETCLIETFAEEGTVRLRVTDASARVAGDEWLGDLPRQVEAAGGTLTVGLDGDARLTVEAVLPAQRPAARPASDHGLSTTLLAAVAIGFSIKLLLLAGTWWPAVPLAVIIVMQLRSLHGRHMVALSVMAVLTFAPIPIFGQDWLGVSGFLIGPLLLAFPWAVALPLAGAVVAVTAICGWLLGLPVALAVNNPISVVVTGLVIYGLGRLAQLTAELRDSAAALARTALVEERLRAARDLHDLLGHSLAAILLKCELARRLDAERARQELDDVLVMTERAMADLRSVSGDGSGLSLAAEAESARSVLKAAGVEVELDLDHPSLGEAAETTLGVVLREAVTNVLRHSSARHVAIVTRERDGEVWLSVSNDEARAGRGRRGSAGIGNLTMRLAALEGRLETSLEDGWFELTARLPAPG